MSYFHMAGLDIKLLRMLVAIDRQGSLTRAGQSLGMTQSALSHHIKEAERRTAVAIFHRVGKRMRFSAIGEELLEGAKTILAEVDRIEADLTLFREGYGPVVLLGSGAYGCEDWLPSFIGDLGRGGSRFAIEILETGLSFPLVNSVIDGQVDIAICGGEIADRRVRSFHLFEDQLVALLPANHPLASRPFLEAADFADEVQLSYSTISEKGFEDDRFFRPARVMPKRWLRAGDVAMIVEMVRHALGVAILSRWAVEWRLAGGGLVLKQLGPHGLPTAWHAVIRAGEPPSSPAGQTAAGLAQWWAKRAGHSGRHGRSRLPGKSPGTRR
jgi:LysR family transcriptional regulator, regulator for metE and metH